MLLLMASTNSFHFDSFIAKIYVIFSLVVAWKRARKGAKREAYILAPFFAATILLSYDTFVVVTFFGGEIVLVRTFIGDYNKGKPGLSFLC